ncbi:MAG: lasso peptide biosynthesis B2 protein [Conexibacter sp.]
MSAEAQPVLARVSARARRLPRPTAANARLAAEVLLTYVRARHALARRRPLPALLAELRAVEAPAPSEAAALALALRLGRVVARTLAPLPGDARCLGSSLVLVRMLARRGVDSTVVIAARTEPRFLAHAWVERDGVALLRPADPVARRLVQL